MTRLYTHQGASIGFHLAYFLVLSLSLLGDYLRLGSSLTLEIVAVLFILFLSHTAALLVPFNLWRAYGRVDVHDGAVTFGFVLVGPLWAYFFVLTFPLLLASISGAFILLSALTLLAIGTTWRRPQHKAATPPGRMAGLSDPDKVRKS